MFVQIDIETCLKSWESELHVITKYMYTMYPAGQVQYADLYNPCLLMEDNPC